ncbi:MAG: pilus assembly protein [Salaquimonas sp.]|jgi:Flp pilus assembly protein TadG|nr:pilus assembly protein [Salaquimonas sp.]
MKAETLLKSLRLRTGMAVSLFRRDQGGVAAVEFAFIAPIMILLFVGTIELSAGISTDRKLARVASAIGDLVTQSQVLTSNDIENIMNISAKIMYPYDESVDITITGMDIESGQAKSQWACNITTGCTDLNGTDYTVPAKIKKDGSFLVSAVVSTTYTPSFGWAHYDPKKGVYFSRTPIQMRDEIFLRPRIGSSIELQ